MLTLPDPKITPSNQNPPHTESFSVLGNTESFSHSTGKILKLESNLMYKIEPAL
jgi:hypothetical protein